MKRFRRFLILALTFDFAATAFHFETSLAHEALPRNNGRVYKPATHSPVSDLLATWDAARTTVGKAHAGLYTALADANQGFRCSAAAKLEVIQLSDEVIGSNQLNATKFKTPMLVSEFPGGRGAIEAHLFDYEATRQFAAYRCGESTITSLLNAPINPNSGLTPISEQAADFNIYFDVMVEMEQRIAMGKKCARLALNKGYSSPGEPQSVKDHFEKQLRSPSGKQVMGDERENRLKALSQAFSTEANQLGEIQKFLMAKFPFAATPAGKKFLEKRIKSAPDIGVESPCAEPLKLYPKEAAQLANAKREGHRLLNANLLRPNEISDVYKEQLRSIRASQNDLSRQCAGRNNKTKPHCEFDLATKQKLFANANQKHWFANGTSAAKFICEMDDRVGQGQSELNQRLTVVGLGAAAVSVVATAGATAPAAAGAFGAAAGFAATAEAFATISLIATSASIVNDLATKCLASGPQTVARNGAKCTTDSAIETANKKMQNCIVSTALAAAPFMVAGHISRFVGSRSEKLLRLMERDLDAEQRAAIKAAAKATGVSRTFAATEVKRAQQVNKFFDGLLSDLETGKLRELPPEHVIRHAIRHWAPLTQAEVLRRFKLLNSYEEALHLAADSGGAGSANLANSTATVATGVGRVDPRAIASILYQLQQKDPNDPTFKRVSEALDPKAYDPRREAAILAIKEKLKLESDQAKKSGKAVKHDKHWFDEFVGYVSVRIG